MVGAGAQVDARADGQQTPLMLAAYNGQASTVQLLVDAGAGIGLKDGDGSTAADLARSNGHSHK